MIIYYDEAWRWPLAWPIYVWLTILIHPLLKREKRVFKDSKKLSKKQKNILYKKIKSDKNIISVSYSSSNIIIDNKWIVFAIRQAVLKWLWKLLNKDNCHPCEGMEPVKNNTKYYSQKKLKQLLKQNKNIKLILDWNTDFWIWKKLWIQTETIIKWDDKIQWISISSIVAKVERDEYMKKTSKKDFFKNYWFEKHKWYWTKQHIQNIKKHWLSKIHRKSYCKNILNIYKKTNEQ